ncbi:inositol monophosphatase family protein [Nocardioides bruguierae]|uniref:Inositol monophosphatase n=1 Tax=Nocardioides bruguierae TaxID=2945102 RepID=A0A9X2DA23_9ACTN|nr:inositol monophosphatase [Nocardioides bruguierae]MCM0622077.1 inositol monophosphatase [Nocardioides bruguierae]
MGAPTSNTPAAGLTVTPDDVWLAGDLVREAAGLAARMRAEAGGSIATDTKTSVSDVVTAADKAAEAHVLERLAQERPDDGVLGEEGATSASASGREWVIDPVDGTWNFVAGIPWWCSALALRTVGTTGATDVLLGAVHDPAQGRTFVGGPGVPTTVNGEPLPPLADVDLASSGVATYLHPTFQHGPVGDAWRRAVSGVATIRALGSSSMDSTAVAEGRLGCQFQHSLPDWDRLPGAALVLGLGGAAALVQAGGRTWNITGAPRAVAEVEALLLAQDQ